MKEIFKPLFFIIGLLTIIAASFLAGALAYRSGMISDLKSLLLPDPEPTYTPTLPTQEINTDYGFELLDDPSEGSMNSIPLEDNGQPIKFLVAGHVYGRPGDEEYHPATTLINNIALLRNLDPDFIVLLGDTVWKPQVENFEILDSLVLDPLQVPVFNAVGNHDVTKREIYQARYGSTVFGFVFKDQLFIFLDTTLQYYDLNPDQLDFVRENIELSIQTAEISTIHIFMHHLLFLDRQEVFSKQILKPNEGDGISEAFHDFVRSTLYPISETTPILIYAGDVGAFKPGNLSPLYKRDSDYNITYLATGLGNHQNDSILIIEEDPDQNLSITPFSLTGKGLKPIESYDFEYWLSK
jgi:hypothetical protein